MRKTFQEKLTREFKIAARQISLYGTEDAKVLDSSTSPVYNLTRKIKSDIECLKMSASLVGAYSLSANQVGLGHSYFIIAKNLRENVWLNRKLDKEIHYNVYINPKLNKASHFQEYGWEYCASFPNVRASVKRHDKVIVKYLDENLEENEKMLTGFEARVFQHEMNHINGYHMLNWEISGGDIELIPGAQEDFPNFDKALSEYRDVLAKLKREHPEMFDNVRDEDNSSEWISAIRNNSGMFSREGEFMQKLEEAIKKDIEMHEREGWTVPQNPNIQK